MNPERDLVSEPMTGESALDILAALRADGVAASVDGEQGGGVQPQLGGGSFRYPPEEFVRGRIANAEVGCISAEVQVLCHLGYEPTAKDAHDVLLLCRQFGLPVPSPDEAFRASKRAGMESR